MCGGNGWKGYVAARWWIGSEQRPVTGTFGQGCDPGTRTGCFRREVGGL